MALIQCPKCGQQISEHARKCPKCGADFTKNQDSVNNDVLLESNPKDTPSKKEHIFTIRMKNPNKMRN